MFGNVDSERAALELTYEGEAEVIEYIEYTAESGATRHREEVVGSIPCSLSQRTGRAVAQGEDRAAVEYDAKLFIAPEHDIKPGSKVKVKQNSMDYTFICAGEPFRYPTHQEIILRREVSA